MPFAGVGPFGPVYAHTRPRNILGNAELWQGESYTFDSSKVTADTYGMKYLRPGTLVRYNASTYMVEPVTAATYSTYACAPVLTFYDVTFGNTQVEVVFAGQVVERYCYGLMGADLGDPVEYGYIPTAVKSSLPMILWR